jgi:hypothetical protein
VSKRQGAPQLEEEREEEDLEDVGEGSVVEDKGLVHHVELSRQRVVVFADRIACQHLQHVQPARSHHNIYN